ncbi:hypothetical protein BH10CYA1_BH10CYA1_17720 [soil metagenome]
MELPFSLSGGTFPGYKSTGTDIPKGGRNQDSLMGVIGDGYIVIAVNDGCSGNPEQHLQSELGALAGSQIVCSVFADIIESGQPLWETVTDEIVDQLSLIAVALSHGRKERLEHVVRKYLMFTSVVAVIGPEETTIATVGDGYYAINGGDLKRIGPYPDNQPPYLGYLLYPNNYPRELLTFQKQVQLPTADLQSLIMGSDGLGEVAASANKRLPGKSSLVGSLTSLLDNPRFFRGGKNPENGALVPWLRGLNSSVSRIVFNPGNGKPDIEYSAPLIEDDYTCVLVKRTL